MPIDLKNELRAQGRPQNYVADLTKRAADRIDQLERALATVRHEICLGPVDDTLWHMIVPAETTVDFICNTLGDDWDYGDWLAKHGHKIESKEGQSDG